MLPYNANNDAFAGSHMPLDTSFNWDWRNPLTLLPLALLLLFLVGLLGLFFG